MPVSWWYRFRYKEVYELSKLYIINMPHIVAIHACIMVQISLQGGL